MPISLENYKRKSRILKFYRMWAQDLQSQPKTTSKRNTTLAEYLNKPKNIKHRHLTYQKTEMKRMSFENHGRGPQHGFDRGDGGRSVNPKYR